MQNPNLNTTNIIWVSTSGVALLWFLYWIIYDLVIWGKQFTQINPLNYLGAILALTFMLFSGLGTHKTEAACYLGSTAATLWFTYWITNDLFVWNKTLTQIDPINYIGIALSLTLIAVPKVTSWITKRNPPTQIVQTKPQKAPKQTKKRTKSKY